MTEELIFPFTEGVAAKWDKNLKSFTQKIEKLFGPNIIKTILDELLRFKLYSQDFTCTILKNDTSWTIELTSMHPPIKKETLKLSLRQIQDEFQINGREFSLKDYTYLEPTISVNRI